MTQLGLGLHIPQYTHTFITTAVNCQRLQTQPTPPNLKWHPSVAHKTLNARYTC